jgi:hypothetical protein
LHENCRVRKINSPYIDSVYNERSKEYFKQENAEEYAYITADEYTAQQLIEMEKEIINTLGFRLNAPNSMHFLNIFIALLKIPEDVSMMAWVNLTQNK